MVYPEIDPLLNLSPYNIRINIPTTQISYLKLDYDTCSCREIKDWEFSLNWHVGNILAGFEVKFKNLVQLKAYSKQHREFNFVMNKND